MQEFEREVAENNLNETKRCIDHLIKITKWLVILGIVCIVSMAAVHGMTLWYLYQYDFSVETVTTTETLEQSTEGGGNANYIGRDGSIYGKAESDQNDNGNP